MLDVANPLAQLENARERLARLVSDMSQEALEYRGPSGDWNSAAMLIQHLAVVDLSYLYLILGAEPPADLEALVGPFHDEHDRLPVVAGVSAAELLERYGRVLAHVQERLAGVDMVRSVKVPWWPEPATVRYVLWHMAGHSMLHQGQIARLKALFALR